jgi:formate hydrogenlyase subunit 4
VSGSFLAPALALVGEYLLVLGLSPLLLAVLRRVKARTQGRIGPPLLQPYRDLWKWMGKDGIYASSASWITRYAPAISFAALLAAVPLVPWFVLPTPLGPFGDLILLVGLLGLSRFVIALAALDGGSTFGGMGSSREMWMGALAEPVFLLVIFAFGSPAGSTQAGAIAARGVALGIAYANPPLLLAIVAYVLLLLVETGRLPVDNPATHLELTMVHEAMVLEYTGRDLALIEWGRGFKLAIMFGLLIALAAPWGISTSGTLLLVGLAVGIVVGKLLGAHVLVGRLEARVAKWRLFRVADLLTLAAVFAFGSLALAYVIGGGA